MSRFVQFSDSDNQLRKYSTRSYARVTAICGFSECFEVKLSDNSRIQAERVQ